MQEFENIFKIYKNYFLFYASKYEKEESFLKLLYLYSNLIHQKNSVGETLAHLLCYEGMTEKYYPYINMGGINTLTQFNNSVLHYCTTSNADIFLMIDLINKGEDPLLCNNNGQTSIHMVSSLQSASYFVNWNFRTSAKIQTLTDLEGNSIAHTAALNKHEEIMLYFLKEFPQLKHKQNKLGLTPQQCYFLITHPFLNLSIYKSKEFFSLFPHGIFNIYLNGSFDEIKHISIEGLALDNYQLFSKITKKNLTSFDKLKPLSIPILKNEAKELFLNIALADNIDYNIYQDKVLERIHLNDHNFNL